MRVFVLGLISAGSFLMLSADTRGIDLPSAEWCSSGTLVPVAEFHLYPAALRRLEEDMSPTPRYDQPVFKMVGEFDDDYPRDPRDYEDEDEDDTGEIRIHSIVPDPSSAKMVGEFDDDYPSDPRDYEDEESEGEIRVRSIAPDPASPKMVGEFDDDYPTDPRDYEDVEEEVSTANAYANAHCAQFAMATSKGSDSGEVIAVAEWPRSLVKADGGQYRLSQGVAGICLRCE